MKVRALFPNDSSSSLKHSSVIYGRRGLFLSSRKARTSPFRFRIVSNLKTTRTVNDLPRDRARSSRTIALRFHPSKGYDSKEIEVVVENVDGCPEQSRSTSIDGHDHKGASSLHLLLFFMPIFLHRTFRSNITYSSAYSSSPFISTLYPSSISLSKFDHDANFCL